jgi:hypothetical protein
MRCSGRGLSITVLGRRQGSTGRALAELRESLAGVQAALAAAATS